MASACLGRWRRSSPDPSHLTDRIEGEFIGACLAWARSRSEVPDVDFKREQCDAAFPAAAGAGHRPAAPAGAEQRWRRQRREQRRRDEPAAPAHAGTDCTWHRADHRFQRVSARRRRRDRLSLRTAIVEGHPADVREQPPDAVVVDDLEAELDVRGHDRRRAGCYRTSTTLTGCTGRRGILARSLPSSPPAWQCLIILQATGLLLMFSSVVAPRSKNNRRRSRPIAGARPRNRSSARMPEELARARGSGRRP